MAEPDLMVVGEAADGSAAVELAIRLRPQVVITDVAMPGLNGLEVTREVVRRLPGTRVVVLSMYANEGYIQQALRYGASAFVLKDSQAADLIRAVREAQAGRRYLSPPLPAGAIDRYLRRSGDEPPDPFDTLTAREREVLHLAAEGLTSAEISGRLFISPRTVEIHRAQVLRKLSLKNQTELVRFALRRGIVSLDG